MKYFASVFSLLLITALFSCNKKEGCTDPAASNYDPAAETNSGCVYINAELHFHPHMFGIEFSEGDQFTINGVATELDVTRFYVSHPRLIDANGNETPVPNEYFLITPDQEEYQLGTVPAGDYTAIRFEIGIGDSAINHGDPSLYQIGDPLGAQFPSMHWGWDFGYIFLRIDGIADTDGNGALDEGFEMHLGTEDYLTTITVDYPITMADGNENIYHLVANWDRIFDGIDLATDNTTHTTDNLILAGQVQDNLANFIVPE